MAILRKALSIALSEKLVETNVAECIEPFPKQRRDRAATDHELLAVIEAIGDAPIRPQVALLFKLLIFTGCGTGEWRQAEWSWIDETGRILRLLDSVTKTGARPVVLSTIVQVVLANTPRVGKVIVPDDTGRTPLAPWSVNDAWETIRRTAKVDDLNVHDLRHAYATRGALLGASAVVLRDALGHRTLQMTNRYMANLADPVRALAERIGTQIQGISNGASMRRAAEQQAAQSRKRTSSH